MGHQSTSMFCLVLFTSVVLAHCLPFSSPGQPAEDAHPPRGTIDRYGMVAEHVNHEQTTDILVDNSQGIAQPSAGGKGLDELVKLDSIELDSTIKPMEVVHERSFSDGQSTEGVLSDHANTLFNNEEKGGRQDTNATTKLVNSSDHKQFEGDQFHIPNYHSFLNTYLKGFQRETIYVPAAHRKHRHRRDAFLAAYGITDDDDVVFSPHTSPCDIADRYYCLNGGTCVFVGALELKTCRCKIGYTGLRCEMINQEFLLALLSDNFFG